MIFRQYQLGCLSLHSYLIGDEVTGRSVVVDPQRDIDQYLSDAADNGMRIERVIETHFHADFVSGQLELAAATGAAISYGDAAIADFVIDPLAHGQRLVLGDVVLEVRHTPGHTPESIALVVWEHADDLAPWGVLTGDTLFVGDVGRPDLLVSGGMSADVLARHLYRSLHEQLLTLPDETLVFPAHGAGSSCGKSLSAAPSSTIGEQRATNYALAPMDEDRFVEVVTESQPVQPLYFGFAADANRQDHPLFDVAPPTAIAIDDVMVDVDAGTLLLDTRSPEIFASGHLRGSVNVGLDGRFAEYAGDVALPAQPILVVADPGREGEVKLRLARIGFDTVAGFLPDIEAALVARPELAQVAARLSAAEILGWVEGDDLQLVDVRNPAEAANGTIDGAQVIPLARLLPSLNELDELDAGAPTIVYRAGGYRSSIAASLLRAHGFTTVADVLGGYGAWATLVANR